MAPRRLKKFQSSRRVKVLTSAGFSTKYNSRNIENPFYTAYVLNVDELVASIKIDGILVTRQQLKLWISGEALDQLGLSKNERLDAHPDGYSDDEDEDEDGSDGGEGLDADEDAEAVANDDAGECLASERQFRCIQFELS